MKSRLLARLDASIASARDPTEAACLSAERASLLARLGRFDEAADALATLRAGSASAQSPALAVWLCLADGMLEPLRDEGVRPIGREGEAASHWILVDLGSVIVHVFTPPERDFYQLEKHWSEAKTILRVQ